MKAGYDKHPTKSTVEWTTPRGVIQALGPFDLDPCTHVDGMPWARSSFVWHNPPYRRGQGSLPTRGHAAHGEGRCQRSAGWSLPFLFQGRRGGQCGRIGFQR